MEIYKPQTNITYGIIGFSMSDLDLSYITRMRCNRFYNYTVDNLFGKKYDFTILNTNHYHFDIDNDNDKDLLKYFIYGVSDSYKFSKDPVKEPVLDSENTPTNIILKFNARDLYNLNKLDKNEKSEKLEEEINLWNKITKWISYFNLEYDDHNNNNNNNADITNDVNLNKLNKLYKFILNSISKTREIDIHKAKEYIIILITHLEMIPINDRYILQNNIIQSFINNDVLENHIYFISKECEWTNKDLLEYEDNKTNDFPLVANDGLLGINKYKCINSNCEHKFTYESKKNFMCILKHILDTNSK